MIKIFSKGVDVTDLVLDKEAVSLMSEVVLAAIEHGNLNKAQKQFCIDLYQIIKGNGTDNAETKEPNQGLAG